MDLNEAALAHASCLLQQTQIDGNSTTGHALKSFFTTLKVGLAKAFLAWANERVGVSS